MRTEFEFIDHIRKTVGSGRIGDDCAVLAKDSETDQLLTADLLIEDIDFRLGWTTPELLGHKALAVSLSDIAAMGGTPVWAMTSIAVPAVLWDSDFLDRFYTGWGRIAANYGVELVGGDISKAPDKLVIDSIVGGAVPKGRAVLRSGARPGDLIFVTGTVGGTSAGLGLLESGLTRENADDREGALISRQLSPTPRIDIGKFLLSNRLASAMIDVSDGLSSDLHHICIASGVGASLILDRIPFDSQLEPSQRDIHKGGEDFELLFTVPKEMTPLPKSLDVSQIGEVTAKAGQMDVIVSGVARRLTPTGFTHF